MVLIENKWTEVCKGVSEKEGKIDIKGKVQGDCGKTIKGKIVFEGDNFVTKEEKFDIPMEESNNN